MNQPKDEKPAATPPIQGRADDCAGEEKEIEPAEDGAEAQTDGTHGALPPQDGGRRRTEGRRVRFASDRVSATLAGVAALLIILIVALVALKKPEENLPSVVERPTPVQVLALQPRRMPIGIIVSGSVEPVNDVLLPAEKGGRIVSLPVARGATVQVGDVVMSLDDRIFKAEQERASIALAQASRDFARWDELHKSGAVSDSDYDAVRDRRDLAQVSLEQARVLLSQCHLTSPVSGIVQERFFEPGEFVNEGQAVLRVLDPQTLKVTFSVPEKHVLSMQPGLLIPLTINTIPGATFTGKVSFVASAAEPASNTYDVEMELLAPDRRTRPGMIADVALTCGTIENAMVVPLNAVIPERGEDIVFTVERTNAVRHVVQIVELSGHEAVVEGLHEGQLVVVEGQRNLRDGGLVTVVTNAEIGE